MVQATIPNADPTSELRAMLAPILARVAELRPQDRVDDEAVSHLEQALETEFPYAGDQVRAIGQEIARGVAEGWLCNRGDESSRFSRVAKPDDSTHQLSIDCVSMIGSALDHTHTLGEVTLGFAAADADPEAVRFEGRPAGWVFLGPGSRHCPQVDGGRMNLIYFLPEGAVQWHMGDA